MPGFARLLLSALLTVTLLGCEERGGVRFKIEQASIKQQGSALNVELLQQLRLSANAQSAILNGVPLTLQLEIEVRDSNTLTLLAADTHRYRIRYLPMSERYSLEDSSRATTSTYPRLRHALQSLSRLRLQIETPTLAEGNYELRARFRLDRASLPAPVQLPSLIFRAWHHDTDWTQWPFRING